MMSDNGWCHVVAAWSLSKIQLHQKWWIPKGSFYEGGIVRALAFANGGLIPENMRGKATQGSSI